MTHAKIEAYCIAYLMIVTSRRPKPALPILRHEHTGNDGIYQSLSTGKSSVSTRKGNLHRYDNCMFVFFKNNNDFYQGLPSCPAIEIKSLQRHNRLGYFTR